MPRSTSAALKGGYTPEQYETHSPNHRERREDPLFRRVSCCDNVCKLFDRPLCDRCDIWPTCNRPGSELLSIHRTWIELDNCNGCRIPVRERCLAGEVHQRPDLIPPDPTRAEASSRLLMWVTIRSVIQLYLSFLSTLFYSVSVFPSVLAPIVSSNPMTWAIQAFRQLSPISFAQVPAGDSLGSILILAGPSLAFALLGTICYIWYSKL